MSKFKSADVSYEKAKPTDLEEIVKLSLQVPQVNGLETVIQTDVEKGTEFLKRLLDEDLREGCILVAKLKGTIVGILALAEGEIWWSKQRFFTNVVLYVHPKYRRLGIQKKFFDFSKLMARDSKLPFVLDFFSLDSKCDILNEYAKINGFKTIGFKSVFV